MILVKSYWYCIRAYYSIHTKEKKNKNLLNKKIAQSLSTDKSVSIFSSNWFKSTCKTITFLKNEKEISFYEK